MVNESSEAWSKTLRVLVACEFSGRVREAFRKRGHDAWSCDFLPTEIPSDYHLQGDVLNCLEAGWELMIAHPPCTYLAISDARWFKNRQREQEDALNFVRKLLDAPIPRIALENPISIISSRIRKPDQIIQPWMFGEPFQKSTCLWLKELPKLVPTKVVSKGDFHVTRSDKKYPTWYGNTKGKNRSRTFIGIAEAMAEQWGSLC
jgi:hypothetical protein